MTILPPKAVATTIGLSTGGIMVLEANVIWAKRNRYDYVIEALIDVEIAYKTDQGYVIARREALVNAPITRVGGTRARLIRAAALLTAVTTANVPAQNEPVAAPLAA
ncbi:hypothetical protein [Gymnodinialimonas hymeniacidonis]|uniref:hypothetical protein n=1 Tax=Gymnodinialimonas hymeniacidonis TaxID=3126508 RepID=UPI0034C6AD66